MNIFLTRGLLLASMVLVMLGTTPGSISAADHVAFSRGVSEPPFLSYGIKSNLLLLLDNSGSMLDMAYAGEEGQCFDDGYLETDPTLEYAGYFKHDSWYVWRESYYQDSTNARPYLTDRAYPSVSYWKKNTSYANGELVIDNGIFYKATCASGAASCTSSPTAPNLSQDNIINWLPATNVSSWTAGRTYTAGSFIKHKGQLYFLTGAGNYLSVTDPADDGRWQPVSYTWRPGQSYPEGNIVTYNGMVYRSPAGGVSATSEFDWSKWQRLDEGYFEEVGAAPCTSPSYTASHTDSAGTSTDLQITMVDAVGNTITDVSTQTPASVTCFAAKGNFLNWASASKFDIQKKILTGGKYHAGYEDADNTVTTDNGDDRLVGEHRGCAGTGFVKQITVKNGSGASHILTLRVRGAMGDNPWIVQTDDRVDTTDSTTRIELLAVSVQGFDVSACTKAAEELTSGSSGATAKQEIESCLNYSGSLSGTENSTTLNSLIECTQYWDGKSVNVSNLESHCKKIYRDGTLPIAITPWDPEYICYGVYNPYIPTVEAREGYMGACWGLYSEAGTCTEPATCTYSGDIDPGPTGLPHRCSGGLEFQCPASATYRLYKDKYICENKNNKDDGWVALFKNSTGYCTYDGGSEGVADWVNDPTNCTRLAAYKFCSDLQVPEVIDPSDKATTTSDTYNLPAMLIDAGVMGQLNTSRPLAVFKGYIKQPEKPKGILHATAGDLRIGAMAFNDVGSASEDSTNSYIARFSPPGNKDGGSVISEIKLGSTTTIGGRTHVDDLAEAINDVRATSWTPLAEAIYNAIGYYTQNSAMRIDVDDFPIGVDHDPVTNWCQDNNILIITEGASTADLNADMKNFADSLGLENNTACADGLDGSTYLDDLTHHAWNAPASQLYPVGQSQLQTLDGEWKDKQNIRTYIVATGGLRGSVDDPSQCTAARLINDAATNGGTSLYDSASPAQLEKDLLEIFNALRQRASAGSAASVISSARGGEGAVYQAIFWPEIKRNDASGMEYSVAWTGDVYALFVDSNGFIYEDTNGDQRLDTGDKRVIMFYDEVSGTSKACYDTEDWQGTCPAAATVGVQDVKFLWSAAKWLSSVDDVTTNRSLSSYISGFKQRYIYTWNDLNNDGIVGEGEWIPFEAGTNWSGFTVNSDRNIVPVDFDVVTANQMPPAVADAKVDDIVNWIRGQDRSTAVDFNGNALLTDDGEAPLRSRKMPSSEGSATMITARLGDVIHSTPMVVSSPAEGFHLIYNDYSYAEFVKHYKQRRHVIYFGSNDGMLHAVNGGFYVEQQKKFCTSSDCQDNSNQPALGAELWAYVPYNLLPHLSSLTRPDYKHKYYVDLRPRIFDAQIFTPDEDHPEGWGTILVGGMRLGGAPINASELNNSSLVPGDVRQFISSYFIFDITNPEKPPRLLGETTRRTNGSGDTDLGHSTVNPTLVSMKIEKAKSQSIHNDNKWYLILGSGPHAPIGSNAAMKGISDQKPRVAVLPLDWLVESPLGQRKGLRIPDTPPVADNHGGTFLLEDSSNGFTSDLITVDFDINPNRTSYMSDIVYFGTNEGNFATRNDGTTFWDGGGRLYRLMTRNEIQGEYHFGRSIVQEMTTPDKWSVTTLLDAGQPISSAPNVGYDGHNYWVYFGTGRFFDGDDKTDDTQQSFYGIKEPMVNTTTNGVKQFLATSVPVPAHGTQGTPPDAAAAPGSRGLLKVDEIRVASARTPALSELSCREGGLDCLPEEMKLAGKTRFSDLIHYIADPDPISGDPANLFDSTDGWYYDFYSYGNRERNLSQATLFGGLVTFTTYQPFLDQCQAEGISYLYALYYRTGTAWHKPVLGQYPNSPDNREKTGIPGPGIASPPNLHSSPGGGPVRVVTTTSSGVIHEFSEDELPTSTYFTGRSGWKQCTQ